MGDINGNGRWDFGGNIGLPAGDLECESNWPNSTVCTAQELIWASQEGQLEGAVDVDGTPVASWWNNDDEAADNFEFEIDLDQIAEIEF